MCMRILEKAIRLAVTAHQGQLDKDGTPHILHAMGVMFAARDSYLENPVPGYTLEEFMSAAILHDVPEDTEYKLPYILENFGENIHQLVEGVTRRRDVHGNNLETYKQFILRAYIDPGSRRLKKVDVTINRGRVHTLPESERSIQRRYDQAAEVLDAESVEEAQLISHRQTTQGRGREKSERSSA